jgi:colicin import membrane protein
MAASRHALLPGRRRLRFWAYSLLLHVGIVACLLMNFHWGTAVVPSLGGTSETEPVKATVVDQKLIDQQMAMLKSEQEKKHQEKQQLEQNLTDLKQQQSAAQQQVNQQMADMKARADRLAKLKAEDDALAQKQKTRDNASQRALLQQEIANEEKAQDSRLAGLKARYMALIQQKIQNNWVQPASTPDGLTCKVEVRQVVGGSVTSANVLSCNGDDAVRQSIVTAVLKASPLPAPPDPSLFDPDLTFDFVPRTH